MDRRGLEGGEPLFQRKKFIMHPQPQAAGADVVFDEVAVGGRESAGVLQSGAMIWGCIDVYRQHDISAARWLEHVQEAR